MITFRNGEIVKHKLTGDRYEVAADKMIFHPDQKVSVHHQPRTNRGTKVMAKYLQKKEP